jgi:sugar lactone lactonase YvrE
MSELKELVAGLDFGEGLRWRDGVLWHSDFFQRTVCTVTLQGDRRQVLKLEDRPSGLGWLPDGRLLIVSMDDRRVVRRELDGELVVHADLAGLAAGPCNDMVVARDGTAYVGCFGFDVEAGEAFRPASLFRVSPDGAATVAAEELAFPNGSVIQPDGSTLIVGETFAQRYTAFTIAEDGSLHDRRTWATLDGVAPDGCALDADGGIWVANLSVGHGGGPGEVVRTVEGGTITHRVTTPQTAYACALGGTDGNTLFVATAPGALAAEVSGKALGRIHATTIDFTHTGQP